MLLQDCGVKMALQFCGRILRPQNTNVKCSELNILYLVERGCYIRAREDLR